MLSFKHTDGRIINVKERTITQIEKCLKRYVRPDERGLYKYVEGTQYLSPYNGNIYADFETYDKNGKRLLNQNGEVFVTSLYISDYYDYINEII